MIDRLIAALAACEVKTYVLLRVRNLHYDRPIPKAEADQLEAADAILYRRKNGMVCVWVGKHRGNVYDTDKLAAIVARLETAPIGPAMALRILRDIA